MKRFQLQARPVDDSTQQPELLGHSLLHSSRRNGLHYKLFAPLHYERNYAYPLLIWLHGPGDNEGQLPRIMPMISMRNYVAISLRGPRPGTDNGFEWTETAADLFAAETGVMEGIEIASEKYHIASNRVFLAGYRSSGTTALRIGLKYPRRFAGVLSVGGPFPIGNAPLLYLNEARELPLFIACGRQSETYPVERTCEELRLFHAAGMHVTVRQYPSGEQLSRQILHDMDVWMMEQVTGANSTEAEDLSTYLDDDA